MKIFVTGHLGFIGPSVLRLLKKAGHEVTALDTGYFRDNFDAGEDFVAPDREIVKDIRDISAEDMRGHDAVVHMAGLSNDPLGRLNEELTYDINLHASNKTADLAKAEGVSRFVFFSSCSLYGVADTSRPVDETAAQAPVTAYAKSKVGTEIHLREIADESFSPVFLRNATCYGISARPRFDLVLNSLCAYGFYQGEIRILSDGSPWRPMVHIDDVAQAVLCAVEADRAAVHAEAFNVGINSENFQIKDLAQIVKSQLPDARLAVTGETGGDDRSYRVDFTKARDRLPGFQPKWSVQKGTTQILDWCRRRQDAAFEKVNGRDFIRLKQIEHLHEQQQIDACLRWA
ncbi:NAD(P)-dependent oxidoreductase [Fodinicurvata sp. EGI_FJ10296]|uniref:NAD-dependent epimerase/dehydratase family protein n=1 Tax=Fodinicurvata sp. EGI_FJ10296 TaxID=3231908 RepID=UPI003456082A